MINLCFERIGIVSPQSGRNEVEDYFIWTITNVSGDEVILDHWLEVTLTDSNNNRALCASDNLCDDNVAPPGLSFDTNKRPGLDVFYVQARGALGSKSSQTIGLKLLRAGLLDEHGSTVQYGDPLRVGSFGNLTVSSLSISYTLIFPVESASEFQCYQIKAPNAKTLTGRTARWDLSPRQEEWQRVRAEFAGGAMPVAATLDSCICILLAAKAESAAIPRADIRGKLQQVIETLKVEEASWDGLSFTDALQTLSDILCVSRSERNDSINRAIEELHKLYRNCLLLRPKLNTTKEVIITQENLARKIVDLKSKSKVNTGIPDRFQESLQMLLAFAQSLRKSPYNWARDHSEKALQNRLHQFLCDTQSNVEREVATGPGRVDFLLINTPVELKAIPLKDDPIKISGQHGQQAADYASLRGYGIGILLILDTQDRSAATAHRPHLSDECSVQKFSSTAGVGGVSDTLVVTITIMAFPPTSSSLKTPLKARRRK